MMKFLFKRDVPSYFIVVAETPREARDILEDCDDLEDYRSDEVFSLDDLQPEFKYVRVLR